MLGKSGSFQPGRGLSAGLVERLPLDRWIVGSLGVVVDPLHEQIHPPVVDLPEHEPRGEPQRGIEAFDVDTQPLAGRAPS